MSFQIPHPKGDDASALPRTLSRCQDGRLTVKTLSQDSHQSSGAPFGRWLRGPPGLVPAKAHQCVWGHHRRGWLAHGVPRGRDPRLQSAGASLGLGKETRQEAAGETPWGSGGRLHAGRRARPHGRGEPFQPRCVLHGGLSPTVAQGVGYGNISQTQKVPSCIVSTALAPRLSVS